MPSAAVAPPTLKRATSAAAASLWSATCMTCGAAPCPLYFKQEPCPGCHKCHGHLPRDLHAAAVAAAAAAPAPSPVPAVSTPTAPADPGCTCGRPPCRAASTVYGCKKFQCAGCHHDPAPQKCATCGKLLRCTYFVAKGCNKSAAGCSFCHCPSFPKERCARCGKPPCGPYSPTGGCPNGKRCLACHCKWCVKHEGVMCRFGNECTTKAAGKCSFDHCGGV